VLRLLREDNLLAEANIEAFLEQSFNRRRLHSALGYGSPEQFEQAARPAIDSAAAAMSFFRHEEIFRSDEREVKNGERPDSRSPAHRPVESPAGYPRRVALQ
jgi:hypothetical protein